VRPSVGAVIDPSVDDSVFAEARDLEYRGRIAPT
jgi:hypothetical protein